MNEEYGYFHCYVEPMEAKVFEYFEKVAVILIIHWAYSALYFIEDIKFLPFSDYESIKRESIKFII